MTTNQEIMKSKEFGSVLSDMTKAFINSQNLEKSKNAKVKTLSDYYEDTGFAHVCGDGKIIEMIKD